jgi:predicted glycogen debranching enzyme
MPPANPSGLPPADAEWLEPDGIGGFASGTVGGARTRRYHALLLAATQPPAGRVVLVNGVEAWVETGAGRYPLSTQRYRPDVVHPRGCDAITGFAADPWPTWTFTLADGTEVTQEILVARSACETVLRWRRIAGEGPARLVVRPLLSGRDYHGLHGENGSCRFDAAVVEGNVVWRPYRDRPAITALSNGTYRHAPDWFRQFLYSAEEERGLDHLEDLASPGDLAFDLAAEDALLVLRAGEAPLADTRAHALALIEAERARRAELGDPVERAAESYIVRRGAGRTIIAGFPWFTDWGRDTFIALRGLCTARGRHDVAREVLSAWAGEVSQGMLPNRFPDAGDVPEFNAVDASLWFVVAAHEHMEASSPPPAVQARLEGAIDQILEGYAAGTRYGIRGDGDGLLAAGVPGVQLTWMDAKVGDHVVTPRIGKPVEIQALWINALAAGGARFAPLLERARASFAERFWNGDRGCLFDVVDVDHQPGRNDPTIRPNQILAVGGLPLPVLEGERAAAVVATVERHLLTPMGLRSLSPEDPAYRPDYGGGVWERDTAYHQGTVWPWLIGPFVDAWLAVHGDAPGRRREARQRFLAPLLGHLSEAGIGHISEVAGGEPPHRPGGCPFQAWSLSELIRIEHRLREPQTLARRARGG